MSGWPPPPPGPPPSGSGPYGHPPPRSSPAGRGRGALIAALLGAGALMLVLAGIVVAIVLVRDGGDDDEATDEVFLEPISSAREPFTEPVGQDEATTATGGGGGAGQAVASQVGGEPGLYGGTRRKASCDRAQLATFLRDESVKARAWAAVLGIRTDRIGSFIDGLTPVLLRSDTRVTNHGFRDGRATATQAVLQAGTAVLVDDRGRPVTKCYCGNPLTTAQPAPQRYTGPRWAGFAGSALTVIVENEVVIETFVVIDIRTGERFSRPRGSDGGDDGPANPPPSSTTTAPPTTDAPETDPAPSTGPPTPTTEAPATTESPPAGASVAGNYAFRAEVAEGSNASCVAYNGTFAVTEQGSGSNRTVRIDAGSGNTFEGPLGTDNSFDLRAPTPGGSGTQTLVGRFSVEGSTITIAGSGTVDSGGVLCNLTFTAERFP